MGVAVVTKRSCGGGLWLRRTWTQRRTWSGEERRFHRAGTPGSADRAGAGCFPSLAAPIGSGDRPSAPAASRRRSTPPAAAVLGKRWLGRAVAAVPDVCLLFKAPWRPPVATAAVTHRRGVPLFFSLSRGTRSLPPPRASVPLYQLASGYPLLQFLDVVLSRFFAPLTH
ncbi:hypothetical protein VTN02DRAFT_3300 [Thermoascus thermophilus]